MKTIFVVLGEYGKYEARAVFISGVFLTKDEALASMAAATERRRVYDKWCEDVDRHRKVIDTRGALGWHFPLNPEDKTKFDEMISEAERRSGPEPEYEPSEHASLYEMPVGEWHKYVPSEISITAD